MNYEKLRSDSKQFQALTSFSVEEFDKLLLHFLKSWQKHNSTYLYNGSYRYNKASTSGRGKLPTAAHKLFFILYYYKNNPIQEALAASFDMKQSQANLWVKKIEFILSETLKESGFTPIRDVDVLHNYLESHQEEEHLLLDATEREVPRSLDYEEQKRHYSGKKKAHSVKNNILSNFEGRILYLSETYQGSKHDKGICNEVPFHFPKLEVGQLRFLWQDTGYQGHQVEGAVVLQPIKKKKNIDLTENEKKYNKSISQFRVYVEHSIGAVKRLRVVKECLRNWKEGARDTVMEIACALHNFRIILRNKKNKPVFTSKI